MRAGSPRLKPRPKMREARKQTSNNRQRGLQPHDCQAAERSKFFPTLTLKKVQVEERIEEESELQTGLLGMLQTGCRVQTQRETQENRKRNTSQINLSFNGASAEQSARERPSRRGAGLSTHNETTNVKKD